MPPTLWGNEDEFVALYTDVDKQTRNYLPTSLIVKLKVTSVPLTPRVDEEKYPKLYASIKGVTHRLDALIPELISRHNIGSNVGLLLLLRGIWTELDAQRSKKYRVIMSDINIFDRIIKVITYMFISIITGYLPKLYLYCRQCTTRPVVESTCVPVLCVYWRRGIRTRQQLTSCSSCTPVTCSLLCFIGCSLAIYSSRSQVISLQWCQCSNIYGLPIRWWRTNWSLPLLRNWIPRWRTIYAICVHCASFSSPW